VLLGLEEDVVARQALFQDGTIVPELIFYQFCMHTASRYHKVAVFGVYLRLTQVAVAEFGLSILLDALQGYATVPQHQILLLVAFFPVNVVWVCTRICHEKLGSSHKLEILPRLESYNLDARVNLCAIYTTAEYPAYLEFGVVLKHIFRKVTRVAAILFEVIGPARHSATLHRVDEAYDKRQYITKDLHNAA
jgi:hypothetical protein